MSVQKKITEKDISDLLTSKAIHFKKIGDNIHINCIVCDDKKARLGISLTEVKRGDVTYPVGSWHCFKCNSGAKKLSSLEWTLNNRKNISHADTQIDHDEKLSIKKDFHIQFFKNHKEDKSVIKELKERKIGVDLIKKFMLGVSYKVRYDEKTNKKYKFTYIAIPYLKKGRCLNIKYRNISKNVPEKLFKTFKWEREKGGISALFNEDVLDNFDYKELFIVESEIDTLSMIALGIPNTVGLTVGAKVFKQEWYERLTRFEKIYILLDNDETGQAGAGDLARRLGMGRCYNLTLPEDVKDPNDYIKKYDLDDFKMLLDTATQFQVDRVRSLGEIQKEILRNKEFGIVDDSSEKYLTRFKKFNKLSNGFKAGYLVIVAGRSKVGKTTFALDLLLDFARQKIPVGIFECEMRPERIVEKYMFREMTNLKTLEDSTATDMIQSSVVLPHNYMHFVYPEMNSFTLPKVIEKLTEMIDRYGIKFILFDNLLFLCRGDDQNKMIDEATQQFKLLAENKNVVFFLITHTRKTSSSNKMPSNDDMKGSTSTFQDADMVIITHRAELDKDILSDETDDEKDGAGVMSNIMQFKITPRYGEGGTVAMAFNAERGIFTEQGELFTDAMDEEEKYAKKRRKKK